LVSEPKFPAVDAADDDEDDDEGGDKGGVLVLLPDPARLQPAATSAATAREAAILTDGLTRGSYIDHLRFNIWRALPDADIRLMRRRFSRFAAHSST
jgi:hypothetical protein